MIIKETLADVISDTLNPDVVYVTQRGCKVYDVGQGYVVRDPEERFIGDTVNLHDAKQMAEAYRHHPFWVIWDNLWDQPYFLGEIMAFSSPEGAQEAIARMPVGVQHTYSVQNILHVESKISDYLYDRTPF